MNRTLTLIGGVALMGALVSGCGTTQSTTHSKWMKVDQGTHTVTLKLVAGYNDVNDYDNFDGYANGQMIVKVPLGYQVKLEVSNNGGIPASVGVYATGQHLAFKGAGESISSMLENPTPGVMPGSSQTYKFTASKVGTYKINNLINRFPEFKNTQQNIGMWDVLQVTASGVPSVETKS